MNDPELPDLLPNYPRTHAESVRTLATAMLRTSIAPVAVTAVLAVIVSTVVGGLPGLWGSMVGVVVSVASGLATLWLMYRTAAMPVHFVMAAALGGFAGKMVVLLVTMLSLRGVDGLNLRSLALTMLAVILVTAVCETIAFRRTKIPTLIVTSENP